MATYGELISVADDHLRRAGEMHAASGQGAQNPQAADPRTTAAMARLAGVLARYAGRAADGFAGQTAPIAVTDAARRAAESLREAQASLTSYTHTTAAGTAPGLTPTAASSVSGAAAAGDADTPAAAWHLRGAAVALGCGLDLLDAHFAVSPDGTSTTRTDLGRVLAAAATARTLLARVSTDALRLAQMIPAGATSAGTPLAAAATHLAAAAAEGRDMPTPPTQALTAVPFPAPPERIAPGTPETPARAAAAISASAQRISYAARTQNAAWAPATSHYVATAAAIGQHLAAIILGHVSQRMRALGEPGAAMLASAAAQRVGEAAARWNTIAAKWGDLVATGQTAAPPAGPATAQARAATTAGAHPLPTSTSNLSARGPNHDMAGNALQAVAETVTADANDIIVRLGRIAHADPAWKPTRRAAAPTATGQIVRSRQAAAAITVAVLHTVDAFTVLAEVDHGRVQRIARTGVQWVPGSGDLGTYVTAARSAARMLQRPYARAGQKGRGTTAVMVAAARALAAHASPEMRGQIELIAGRIRLQNADSVFLPRGRQARATRRSPAQIAAQGLPGTPAQRLNARPVAGQPLATGRAPPPASAAPRHHPQR
jgi:hypothetical protein